MPLFGARGRAGAAVKGSLRDRGHGRPIRFGTEDIHDLDVSPKSGQPRRKKARVEQKTETKETIRSADSTLYTFEFIGPPSLEKLFGGWDVWRRVKAGLFSQDPCRINEAAELVEVWRFRSVNQKPSVGGPGSPTDGAASQGCMVPGYVSATLWIVLAQQLDTSFQGSSDATKKPLVLRDSVVMMYSAALLRMVHSMTDSALKATYREKAAEIQLPEEIVEVRNALAHGSSPPSLSRLRWVSALALRFLHDHYWRLQESQIQILEEKCRSADPKMGKPSLSLEQLQQKLRDSR